MKFMHDATALKLCLGSAAFVIDATDLQLKVVMSVRFLEKAFYRTYETNPNSTTTSYVVKGWPNVSVNVSTPNFF